MNQRYVHGYQPRESKRLNDQAGTLVELLHSDTAYPAGSCCGVECCCCWARLSSPENLSQIGL